MSETGTARRRVVVVDDNQDVLTAVRLLLTGRGFEVVTATTPEALPVLLRENRPDVVLLDMNFQRDVSSGKEGLFWLSRLLDLDPTLPVVMITAYGEIELAVQAMKHGAADFITKPIEAEALSRVLGRLRAMDDRAEILVADDDPAARDVLRRMLAKQGWTVSEAANGREALEALARARPALVFLDLMMPEVDGFEVLATMRRSDAWREVPVVVVTAKDLNLEERQWLRANAEEVFRKGAYDRTELIALVHAMLADRVVPATAGLPTGCPAPAGL
jgi:CheY-like chemotaxis protein